MEGLAGTRTTFAEHGLVADWSSSHALGSLTLFCAAMLALVFILQHERWRRVWFGQEDPRAMGLFRIVFGVVTIFQINGLWELFPYLFTDEGLFLTDTARMIWAGKQFEGFGNGLGNDPYGFLDFGAFLRWLAGPKYSLLFFWGSPTAFWIYWAAFQAAMVLVVFGLWTRPATWIGWFLFHGIVTRNHVYWEGTEHVFRCLFFYLAMSRCGHAYSLDNWLRRRRNRQNGITESLYRLIPRWPRLLVILQVAALYTTTGLQKSGHVWRRGDALYYAVSMDHFQRFPLVGVPWEYIMPVFRMNTHVARAWEIFFPLVVIGLLIRMGLREPVQPLSKRRVGLIRAGWVVFALGLLGLFTALPSDYRFVGIGTPMNSWTLFIGGSIGIGLGSWLLWRLRRKPFSLHAFGSRRVLDLDWFCRWFLGRRIWLSLGVVFHVHLIVLTNIGWFSPSLLVSYLCFFSGEEIGRIHAIVRAWWTGSSTATPTDERPHSLRAPPNSGLPMSVLLVAWTIAVGGIVGATFDFVPIGWVFAGVVAVLVGATVSQRSKASPSERGPNPMKGGLVSGAPLAYGPWGRLLIGSLIAYHITAVTAWLIPEGRGFKEWRGEVRATFQRWLETTQTTQSWGMFSPNPSQGNTFLRVLVTDRNGKTWDLETDMYSEKRRVVPWIWYTRQWKINRRIAGAEGGRGNWYRKWHARYVCRKWALDHDGVAPVKVELQRIYYPTLPPQEALLQGTPEPMKRFHEVSRRFTVYTALCAEEPDGILPTAIRKRHDLPETGDPVHRWERLRNREQAWKKSRRD